MPERSPATIFLSHAGADTGWAEWAAWQLESAGYPVELDVWDWPVGENLITRISDALDRPGQIVVALWSRAYFDRERFTTDEWTALQAGRGDAARVVPLRIEDVSPPTVLRALHYADLFHVNEDKAREILLTAVAGPHRPDNAPLFPQDPPYNCATPYPRATGRRMPGELPPIWNVPIRSSVFTGRDNLLKQVRGTLASKARLAMHGMGGVGKTLLAVEFAHRFGADYDVVWWIDSEQMDLIGDPIAGLARAAGLIPIGADTRTAISAAQAFLRRNHRWLLVFDNAEEPSRLREWIPEGPGQILITSRNPAWAGVAIPVHVNVFSRHESIALLRVQVPSLADELADRIATAAGDLPLGVAQAAGVLAETGMNGEEYLTTLRSRAGEILEEGVPPTYSRSLAATVRVSLERLEREDQSAAQLLKVCACLAPEPIQIGWFMAAISETLPDPLAATARSTVAVRRCVGRLARYGLARVDENGLTLHRLVVGIIGDSLPPLDREAVEGAAEALLIEADPLHPDSPETWVAWAKMLPHVLNLDLSRLAADPKLQDLACNAIWYLLSRGDAPAALAYSERLHNAWSEQLGLDARSTLKVAICRARAMRKLARYEEALAISIDTLTRSRAVLGDDDEDSLRFANNLGNDLRRAQNIQEARLIDEDTLARRNRVLGQHHLDTLRSASNLAIDLHRLGLVSEARRLNDQTLAVKRTTLGDDHPSTLATANSLADDLRELGEASAARALDERTLEARRRVLGQDHPSTLISASNLATDMHLLGYAEEALLLHAETYRRMRAVLGPEHPDTLRSEANLAADMPTPPRVSEA